MWRIRARMSRAGVERKGRPTMSVSSGRARVADLAFQVFGRALHPDWFAVRAHRRVARGAWEADVRIIDGGHAIIWRSGLVVLSEILAGPATPLPEPGLLLHSPLRRDRTASLHPGPGTEYQTCFDAERNDPEVFRYLSDELTLDACPGDLFHRFAPRDRLSPAPVSRIHLDVRVSGLSVQTFHSFPDERAIVRTQSLFEVRPPLPR